MFNTQQAINNIVLQIGVYGRNDRIIEISLDVVDEVRYGQLELILKNPAGSAFNHTCVVLKYKTASLQQRAQKLANLDLLKALKEVGNAMIREHNAVALTKKLGGE